MTQHSGVVNVSEVGGTNYCGRLRYTIELNYYGHFKIVLFKCDWVNVHCTTGFKQHEFGFKLVNFSNLIHTGEKKDDNPYAFSSQVEQVFYVKDLNNPNWHVAIRVKPRDVFDMGKEDINGVNFLVGKSSKTLDELQPI